MIRVSFFVDGFNVYHSIAEYKATRHLKWFDLSRFCNSTLSARESLKELVFFTSFYPGDEDKKKRHQLYNRALELTGVRVVLGEFKRRDRYCKNCGQTYVGYEEKRTDVNIAVEMFRGAVNDMFDKAVLISGDSDLIPAIQAVRSCFPDKILKVILPYKRESTSLIQIADLHMRMKVRHLEENQFPDPLVIESVNLRKPVGWGRKG